MPLNDDKVLIWVKNELGFLLKLNFIQLVIEKEKKRKVKLSQMQGI